MKAIKLKNGTVFATDGLLTVRLLPNGECAPSPIAYEVLEWDLRTENPDTWEYLTEADIYALSGGAGDIIADTFESVRSTLGLCNDDKENIK
jgi:hypothetical protein